MINLIWCGLSLQDARSKGIILLILNKEHKVLFLADDSSIDPQRMRRHVFYSLLSVRLHV